MLYLAGKGDNNVRFMESSNKMPYLTLGKLRPVTGCSVKPMSYSLMTRMGCHGAVGQH